MPAQTAYYVLDDGMILPLKDPKEPGKECAWCDVHLDPDDTEGNCAWCYHNFWSRQSPGQCCVDLDEGRSDKPIELVDISRRRCKDWKPEE